MPGVTGVSVSLGVPPRAGVTFAERLEAEAAAGPVSDKTMMIPFTLADTGYFSTLGIASCEGVPCLEEDRRSTDKRAVIDVDLARALFRAATRSAAASGWAPRSRGSPLSGSPPM